MRADLVGALAGAKLIGCSKAAMFKAWAAEHGIAPARDGLTRKRRHTRWRVEDIRRELWEQGGGVPAGRTDAVLPGRVPECGWLGW